MTKTTVLTQASQHGELPVQEQAPPSVGAPLQDMANGRPYWDTKSGALGAPLQDTAGRWKALLGHKVGGTGIRE